MTDPKSMNMDFARLLAQTIEAANTESARIERGQTPKIVLPEGMPINTAISHLMKKAEEEATRMDVSYTFECWPDEGAYGLQQVLQERYGYALHEATKIQTFFGTKEIKPELRRLQIDHNKYTQVIWGQIAIPAIPDGQFQTSAVVDEGNIKFRLSGTIRAGDRKEVDSIAEDLRTWISAQSIYKGKAILVQTDSEGALSPNYPPEFLDVSKVSEADMLLNEEAIQIVQALIYAPLDNTETLRQAGINLNRGSLLYGDYGTGKTLCAMIAAGKAIANGWTFLYVDKPANILQAMKVARRYAPAVIFVEDVDQFLEERNPKTNEIINELDGITSKGDEIMVIMTTNHVEKVHPALLRQGRMDLVLGFPRPDTKTVEALMRKYAGESLQPSQDISHAAEIMKEQIPASIAECVSRAKLVQLAQTGSDQLTEQALIIAARSLAEHLSLLAPKKELTDKEQDVETVLRGAITAFTNLSAGETVTRILSTIGE